MKFAPVFAVVGLSAAVAMAAPDLTATKRRATLRGRHRWPKQQLAKR